MKAYRIDQTEKLTDPHEHEYTRPEDTSYMNLPPKSPRDLFPRRNLHQSVTKSDTSVGNIRSQMSSVHNASGQARQAGKGER